MASLATILSQHRDLKLLPSNRIKCDVTGHELPPDVNAVMAHLNGKKYKKALEWYRVDYSKYEPYIVPHKSDSTKLYCNVTKQDLNKIPDQIEKHFNGKRFLRLKEEFDADQQKKNASRKKQKKEEASNVESEEEPEFWMPDGFVDDDAAEGDDDNDEDADMDDHDSDEDIDEGDQDGDEVGGDDDDDEEIIITSKPVPHKKMQKKAPAKPVSKARPQKEQKKDSTSKKRKRT